MSTETVLVQTKSGPVRGLFKSTVDQLSYISFQGIPYAQPPVGELRFKVRFIQGKNYKNKYLTAIILLR